MGSLPAAQALRAPGGLKGAKGWGETEVPLGTQLPPAMGTPMEMPADSTEAEEGFPHKNVMLMRWRKLNIDGKDCAGTSASQQN